jgi:rRNA maturation endonuclease Nob1
MSVWIKIDLTDKEKVEYFSYYRYRCSSCGFAWGYGKTKYCPDCGEKMEVNNAE